MKTELDNIIGYKCYFPVVRSIVIISMMIYLKYILLFVMFIRYENGKILTVHDACRSDDKTLVPDTINNGLASTHSRVVAVNKILQRFISN